jgi:uncharacterized protein YjbJ (UPF0337 family)
VEAVPQGGNQAFTPQRRVRRAGIGPAPALTGLKGNDMNWERIQVNWRQYKGSAKQQWGKLSEEQLNGIAGKREYLARRIQEAYGITKEETEKQLFDWQGRQKRVEIPC